MPQTTPPTYSWAVMLGDGSRFPVEAAYPTIEDGHMLLKDSAHKIVFAAAPGIGCSFERRSTAPAPPQTPTPAITLTKYPEGCFCTYSWEFGYWAPAGRMTRNVNWGCKADHADIDAYGALAADSSSPVPAVAAR